GGERQLAEQRVDGGGAAPERPQHVEGVDVAGALPYRVERRLAVEPRHAGVLDVPVAAEALQRLGDEGGTALGDPVLADGGGEAAERLLPLVTTDAAVGGARQPQREGGGGLRLDREVGDDVAH